MKKLLLVALLSLGALAGCDSEKRSMKMLGQSMEPTIKQNEMVQVSFSEESLQNISRWDIILFESPADEGYILMMRAVAFPGETLRMEGGQLFLNGMRVDDEWPFYREPSDPQLHTYGNDEDYTIPAGTVFVLGDNSRFALDSRFYGPIEQSRIFGKAIQAAKQAKQ
ncbi:MAG: signal peptidase I [Verrucomicrobiota bacterium JB022]|nr:signal peptidase I [Verrucomicrobiota bacterium JB022]